MDVKLFCYPGACSLVPQIALEETGIDYQAIMVDFGCSEQLEAGY